MDPRYRRERKPTVAQPRSYRHNRALRVHVQQLEHPLGWSATDLNIRQRDARASGFSPHYFALPVRSIHEYTSPATTHLREARETILKTLTGHLIVAHFPPSNDPDDGVLARRLFDKINEIHGFPVKYMLWTWKKTDEETKLVADTKGQVFRIPKPVDFEGRPGSKTCDPKAKVVADLAESELTQDLALLYRQIRGAGGIQYFLTEGKCFGARARLLTKRQFRPSVDPIRETPSLDEEVEVSNDPSPGLEAGVCCTEHEHRSELGGRDFTSATPLNTEQVVDGVSQIGCPVYRGPAGRRRWAPPPGNVGFSYAVETWPNLTWPKYFTVTSMDGNHEDATSTILAYRDTSASQMQE
ncbi:hypothetical protein FRB99_003046 [Tulasnella sp. 403]|nr:hypothetical protein FRB99_003046 [Tulasnella sp. 403]